MQPCRLDLFQDFTDSAAFVFQIPIVGSVHFLLYNVRITGSALELPYGLPAVTHPGLWFLFGCTGTSGGAGAVNQV
jgi:hypothetical protein